jgi:hypothetical protein
VSAVFHVELRQFPHVARAFNMTHDQLRRRFVDPWLRNEVIELDDRRWVPDRARLTIYEAPELRTDELGLGRGWANVTRAGENVTERELDTTSSATSAAARPAVEELKREIVAMCYSEPIGLDAVLARLNERLGALRVSDRLALAEQGVWELLHEGRVDLIRSPAGAGPVAREQWEPILLAWETWTGAPGHAVLLTPTPAAFQ